MCYIRPYIPIIFPNGYSLLAAFGGACGAIGCIAGARSPTRVLRVARTSAAVSCVSLPTACISMYRGGLLLNSNESIEETTAASRTLLSTLSFITNITFFAYPIGCGVAGISAGYGAGFGLAARIFQQLRK